MDTTAARDYDVIRRTLVRTRSPKPYSRWMLDTALHIAGIALLLLGCLAALATLVIGLPGTFIVVGLALLYGWATGFVGVGWTTIAWLIGLATTAELLELLSATLAAGAESPSRRVQIMAIVGGIVGGIAGTPLLFGLGSLLGALTGAFAGAALATSWEGHGAEAAMRSGFAAFRGRLLGFIVKSAIGVVMVVLLIGAAV